MSSPQIEDDSWGTLKVASSAGTRTYKDAKLWPGGSRKWDWNETGTSHVPGIQPADVEEVVDQGAEVVVLSKGRNRRLQVKSETLDWLDEEGVETEVLETDQAIERYNELADDGESVGALIHSTC